MRFVIHSLFLFSQLIWGLMFIVGVVYVFYHFSRWLWLLDHKSYPLDPLIHWFRVFI